jgi:hypothetical protein
MHQNLQQKGHLQQNTRRVNYDQSYENKKRPEYNQSDSHAKLHNSQKQSTIQSAVYSFKQLIIYRFRKKRI